MRLLVCLVLYPLYWLKKMNKLTTLPLLILAAFLFAGCQSLEAVKPETPRQSIALAYLSVDSLADGVRIAKRDGLIDSDKRDSLVNELQKSLDNINRAESSLKLFETSGNSVDQTELELRLKQAETIFKIVESLLQESIK